MEKEVIIGELKMKKKEIWKWNPCIIKDTQNRKKKSENLVRVKFFINCILVL